MKEVRQIAAEYAVAQTNEVMSLAIAKAYEDGYRDGYRERDEEIPVNLRIDNIEFVDLGLPSGTLWSADYENENGKIKYMPYDKASKLSIPTEEQWKELLEICKWQPHYSDHRCDCIGPNGNFISFTPYGYLTSIKILPDYIYFWIIDNDDNTEKKSIWMHCYRNDFGTPKEIMQITRTYSGYSLPVRLVR